MAAKNQPYIYVQKPDSTTVLAGPVESSYRSDATIAKFTEDWLKLAYSWKTPPQENEAYVRERGVDLPYQLHAASVALVPGYRETYLDSTAKKYQKQFPFK
jgi:hypothetical protein